ncbi:MAG TPA: nitronate monooxygenase [Burkholderiales bacterium]|nr:nitronate monooxygenase [Burkholderiales bacterium]
MKTSLTERFAPSYPIMLAPMGGVSGGALAAGVSNAGGLGMVGGGYGDLQWMKRELELAVAGIGRPWDVGLITWEATREAVALALSYKSQVFFSSFDDASPYADAIKTQGCALEGYRGAQQRGDFDQAQVWGGEVVDLISSVEPGATLTERIGREAADGLRRLGAA